MVILAKLLLSLGIILISAELFTNGVEWLGKKLNLGEGAVGSILAAVGTALPETLIPIIAIVYGVGEASQEIGIGAILGAPFMLGTLALFVTGMAVSVFALTGKRRIKMNINCDVMLRDLRFFLIVYATAILVAFFHDHEIKVVMAFGLLAAYFVYVYRTLKDRSCLMDESELNPLFLARKSHNPRMILVIGQIVLALLGIVAGAKFFVNGITSLAQIYQIPAFILSIIITPIATELPEKFNSVIWVSQRKDTLALGNITGAMVFQSSVIPAIGIFLTPWVLTPAAVTSAILVLLSASLVLFVIRQRKEIHAFSLLLNGIFYAIFLGLVLTKVI